MTTSKYRPLTRDEINEVFEINNCLDAADWNKGMYDAFMMGYRLGKMDGKVLKVKS